MANDGNDLDVHSNDEKNKVMCSNDRNGVASNDVATIHLEEGYHSTEEDENSVAMLSKDENYVAANNGNDLDAHSNAGRNKVMCSNDRNDVASNDVATTHSEEANSSAAEEDMTEKPYERWLSLSCLVSIVVWRDRTKMKKILKKQKSYPNSFSLEKAVTLHYVAEHVKAGLISPELENQIKAELSNDSDSLSLENFLKSSISAELIKDVKTPQVKFKCYVQKPLNGAHVMDVKIRPQLNTVEEHNFFKLFFESFKQVMFNSMHNNLMR